MQRRTVKTISETLEPKQVFDLITANEYPYPPDLAAEYHIHDRAGMALSYLTLGRVTEIFGGVQSQRVYVSGLWNLPEGSKYKTKDALDKRNWKEETIGKHKGITRENVTVKEDFLKIVTMPIVKRSRKVIEKYGPDVAKRSGLMFPLKRGLFNNPFYDQLVPFSWLVIEYLETYAPAAGKLFHYEDHRAWFIMKQVTGMFPNWFRAQADRFCKQCLYRGDMIGYAISAGRVKSDNTMPYQRFAWSADLKDPTVIMDFSWIDPAVEKIKNRIPQKQEDRCEV